MTLTPDRRFRLVNDYAIKKGYVSGFPNFQEADPRYLPVPISLFQLQRLPH